MKRLRPSRRRLGLSRAAGLRRSRLGVVGALQTSSQSRWPTFSHWSVWWKAAAEIKDFGCFHLQNGNEKHISCQAWFYAYKEFTLLLSLVNDKIIKNLCKYNVQHKSVVQRNVCTRGASLKRRFQIPLSSKMTHFCSKHLTGWISVPPVPRLKLLSVGGSAGMDE